MMSVEGRRRADVEKKRNSAIICYDARRVLAEILGLRTKRRRMESEAMRSRDLSLFKADLPNFVYRLIYAF